MSSKQQHNSVNAQKQQQRAALSAAEKHMKMGPSQQITAAIIQQQNRAIAQQNLEKFNSMSTIEKQRLFKEFDKKQFDAPMLHTDNNHSRLHGRNVQPPQLPSRSPHQIMNSNAPLDLQQQSKQQISHKVNISKVK